MEDFINSFGVKNLVIVGGVFLVVILALIVLVFFEKRSKKGKDDLDFYDDSKSDFEDDTEVLEDASFNESKEEKLEVKPLSENLSFSPKKEPIVASRDLPKEKEAPLLEESVATVTEKQDILEEKESDNMTQTAVDTNNYVNNEKPRPVVTSPIFITRPEPVKKEEDTSYKPKREVFSSVYSTSPTLKKDAPTEVLHIEKEVEPWKTASLKNTVDVDAEADVEADKMFDNLESHVDISSNIDVEPKADFSKLSRVKNNDVVYEDESKKDAKKVLEEVTRKLMEEEPELEGPTQFELEQEERSVISYDELKKINYNVDEVNDNLLLDEGNEPITIDELYKRHLEEQDKALKTAGNKIDNPVFVQEEVPEEALFVHEELMKKEEVLQASPKELVNNYVSGTTTDDSKKFHNSLVISPVFGVWQNKDLVREEQEEKEDLGELLSFPKELDKDKNILDNFDTYDFAVDHEHLSDIDVEIKKTETFLHELKKLKNKLD